MYPEPQLLVTATELCLQPADARDLRHDDAGKSFDDIARYYGGTSADHHELLAPDLPGTTSGTHWADAKTTCARALLIEDALGRRGGELDIYVDPVQLLDPQGRIESRRPTPEPASEWSPSRPRVVAHQEVTQLQDFPTTGLRP